MVNNKLFSSLFILVSSFALIFSLIAVQPASAQIVNQKSSNQQNVEVTKALAKVDDAEIRKTMKILAKSINKENGNYEFDSKQAKSLGFTATQANDIEKLYTNYSQAEIKKSYTYFNMNQNNATKNNVFLAAGNSVPPGMRELLVIFAGAAIAQQVIADMYKLSAISACKKWQRYSGVKKACKALGYL